MPPDLSYMEGMGSPGLVAVALWDRPGVEGAEGAEGAEGGARDGGVRDGGAAGLLELGDGSPGVESGT
jgi:hypothetical protein